MRKIILITTILILLNLPIAIAQQNYQSPKCDPTSFLFGFCKFLNEDFPLGWNKFLYSITKNPSFAKNIVLIREQIQQERMKEMAYINLLHQQGQLTKEDYAKKMIELQTSINEHWAEERKEIIENKIVMPIMPPKPICMIPEGCGDNFIKFQECVKLNEDCKIKSNKTACDLFNQNCMNVTTIPNPPIIVPTPNKVQCTNDRECVQTSKEGNLLQGKCVNGFCEDWQIVYPIPPTITVPGKGEITPITLPQQPQGSCIKDEDCEKQNLIHPMAVGQWKCVDYRCVWQPISEQIPEKPKYQLPFGKYVWQIYGE